MSLTQQQQDMAREDFVRAFAATGVTDEDAALALGTTPAYVARVARLDSRRIDDPWILRNYLLAEGKARGVTVTFRVLTADYHTLWFLDGAYIDRGRLG